MTAVRGREAGDTLLADWQLAVEVRCVCWIMVNVAASLAATAAFIAIARALFARLRASDSNTTCTAPRSGRKVLAPDHSAHPNSVRHEVEISCVFFFGVLNCVHFQTQGALTTRKPTRRRTLALFPRWRAPDSNTTCTAPKSDREPLASAYSAYFHSVRHQIEISFVLISWIQSGVLFWTQNATRHAQTYAQTYAGFSLKACASDSNTTCSAPRSGRKPLAPIHGAYFNSVRH